MEIVKEAREIISRLIDNKSIDGNEAFILISAICQNSETRITYPNICYPSLDPIPTEQHPVERHPWGEHIVYAVDAQYTTTSTSAPVDAQHTHQDIKVSTYE